jgi:trimeric autotransporter adhesin
MKFIQAAALLVYSVLHAQSYLASTVAGGVPPPTPPPGTTNIALPYGLALDSAGNLYIADTLNNQIWIYNGKATVLVGSGARGYINGLAASAALNYPVAVAVDASGGVVIADSDNDAVRRVSGGAIATIAGSFSTDTVTEIVSATPGYSGDNGPAVQATLNRPNAVAIDAAGNIYVADSDNHAVRKISAGTITTLAGNGTAGYTGDNGRATAAQLNLPSGVAVDPAGNVYISDFGNNVVRRVSTAGIITTFAGNGRLGFSGDGGPAAQASLSGPLGLAVDSGGNLYIADAANNVVRMVASGVITTVAGNGSAGFSGDGGPARTALLNYPVSVAVAADGTLNIADFSNQRVRQVTGGIINTIIIGRGIRGYFSGGVTTSGDGDPSTSAQLDYPLGVAVDPLGNLLISDYGNNRIRKVAPTGVISTVAGTGVSAYTGDGHAAVDAAISGPIGLALDATGNIYFADSGNSRVRKISTSGTITTFAGNGTYGFSGDGGPATDAALSYPAGIALDSAGNLFVADYDNGVVREVLIADGTISTIGHHWRNLGERDVCGSGAR